MGTNPGGVHCSEFRRHMEERFHPSPCLRKFGYEVGKHNLNLLTSDEPQPVMLTATKESDAQTVLYEIDILRCGCF